jgi:NADH dehydrogenase FAD-containing subunit
MVLLSDKARLYLKFIRFLVPYIPQLLIQKISSTIHRITYRPISDAKTVVVIGGSFAGFFVAQRLIQSLPTGYKLVLIEKNEHLHYVFNFPRFSVLQGKERMAFIPFDGLENASVAGIFERKQATVERLEKNKVVLSNGEEIDFEYCIMATGAKQPFPARLEASATDAACEELRRAQNGVKHAKTIAVVGAGAVGVEMATDIKAYYPEKEVTLFSSRDYVLPGFGPKLRDYALDAIKKLGVNVVLNVRPTIQRLPDGEGQKLEFKDGHSEEFELIVSQLFHVRRLIC